MSNRRSRLTSPAVGTVSKKRRNSLQRNKQRRMLLELLESRELMAIGPQLIGIQPNNDALLRFDRTDIRNVSPQELIFKYGYGYVRAGLRLEDCSLRAAMTQGLAEVRGNGQVLALLKKYGFSADNLFFFPLQ